MIIDVTYAVSLKDLTVVRTKQTGIANLDGVLEVFRELAEKRYQVWCKTPPRTFYAAETRTGMVRCAGQSSLLDMVSGQGR